MTSPLKCHSEHWVGLNPHLGNNPLTTLWKHCCETDLTQRAFGHSLPSWQHPAEHPTTQTMQSHLFHCRQAKDICRQCTVKLIF